MRLKELRKKNALTQQEVAEKLYLTQNGYSSYENGRTEPNLSTLCKLADYYKVSLDYLVGREYSSDLGYLSPEQKSIIRVLKKIDDKHLSEVMDCATKLLDN